MNVLVTGGTGFVGLHVVEQLLAADHDVHVLTRQSSPNDRLPASVEIKYGDICEPETLADPVSGMDAVVHLAAIYTGYSGKVDQPSDTDQSAIEAVNVGGTENLLTAAVEHTVDQFVFASTINAHPELSSGEPTNEYIRSKERAQRLFDDVDSLRHTVLFPTYVVGPRDYRLARFSPFQRVAANRVVSPPMYVPGEYNVVDVRDVARTVETCLESGTEGNQVIAGENVTTGSLFRTIASATDANCTVAPEFTLLTDYLLPPVIDRLHARGIFPVDGAEFREGISKAVVPSRLESTAPIDLTSLRRTVRDTYEWYEQVGLL